MAQPSNKNQAQIKQKGDRGGLVAPKQGNKGQAPFLNQNGANNYDRVGNGPGVKKTRTIGYKEN